jgi:predicted nucleotidyltransferase
MNCRTEWQKGIAEWGTDLRRQYGVRQLWLLGAHAESRPGVPIELLAEVERPLTYTAFHELQARLGDLLGQPVELVLLSSMRSSIDPAIAEDVLSDLIPLLRDTPG